MDQRVVVTGTGVIASIGAGVDAFQDALYAGKTGIAPSARFNNAPAGEIPDFTPIPWLGNKGIRVLDRAARLLCVAAHMALSSARVQIDPAGEGDPETGLVCGTMLGGVHSIATFDYTGATEGPTNVNPADFPNTVINSPTGHAGIKFKLRGINSTISAGFASGLQAIGYAADFLRFGRAKAILAGGLEELCEESFLGFQKAGLMSPAGTPRPFAADRDGTVPGEGAALFMLELAETAKARGAAPTWEIRGVGSSFGSPTESMRVALESAKTAPSAIACVFASANGTRAADDAEQQALAEVFGTSVPPICTPKSVWGEAMGASGALAAVAAGIALCRGALPPCGGNAVVNGDAALVNAVGGDGINVSLVLGKWRN